MAEQEPPDRLAPSDSAPAEPDVRQNVLVVLTGSLESDQLVQEGKRLAEWKQAPWEALYIETPGADRESMAGARAAEALAVAAQMGATVATVAAATVADGVSAHLDSSPARHLVVGENRSRGWMQFWRGFPYDALDRRPELVLHVYSQSAPASEIGLIEQWGLSSAPSWRSYAWAVAFVAGTLVFAAGLRLFLGSRPLDLLFLFPVIAVAAWLGLRPALLAVVLSVLSYNYFLVSPIFIFNPGAPQNLIMASVLIGLAVYTSVLTARMRGRVLLSDRNARENAALAALAQRLTRDSNWTVTAQTVCEYVNTLLKTQAAVFREIDGVPVMVASLPSDAVFGPLDRAALEIAWSEGEETGAGTLKASTADWQFQPLKTSLGILAVLGLAREDGRNPVRADQRLLLSTLVAQAALAHERLKLEDDMRTRGQGKR